MGRILNKDEIQEVNEVVEPKEEQKMGFFEKYKAALWISGIALATTIVGVVVATVFGSDDNGSEENEESDIFDTDEVVSVEEDK